MSQKIIPPKAGFTSTFLTKLKAQEKPYEISDPGCKGLRIKVATSGSKIFLSTVRIQGKRRVLTLGHFPGMTLSEARSELITRKLANKAGTLITDKERKARENAEKEALLLQKKADTITLGTVMDEFEKLVVSRRRSIKPTLSMINVHIRGHSKNHTGIVLADIPIRSVTKQDVKELIFKIRDTKPGVVIDLFTMLRHFFEWSIRQGYITLSPLSAGDKKDWKLVKQPKGDFALDVDERGRVVTTLPEISRLFKILDSKYSTRIGHSLKILLLTGVRTNEFRQAKKEHIDFDKLEWFIPQENTKSYRPEKNVDTSVIVPLTDYTSLLFRELMAISDNDMVINMGQSTLPWAAKDIVSKYGFKRFTPHTLRKTLRSHVIGWCPFEVAEKCLNHSLGQIAQTYDQGNLLSERREALQIWSDKVYRAVYGAESNIIPLRG